MEKAITKAIEGGWTPKGLHLKTRIVRDDYVRALYIVRGDSLFLDPLFWKALGKAEGWKSEDVGMGFSVKEWRGQMHLFIDHIIAGKDINSFFDNLIK